MAIILEGNGTITGVTTFTTPLDDIKFDSIEVTGIATASTFQVGTGVSIGNPRLQNIALYTNDSEWVTVDNVGNVGFGTTNAQIAADTNNAKVINAGIVTANQYFGNQLTAVGANITGVSTFTGDMEALTGLLAHDQIAAHAGDTNTRIRFPSADTVTVETAGSERLRVDSSGRLLLGTTTEGFATYGEHFTIADSSHCGMTIRSGTSSYGTIYFSDGDDGSADEVRGFLEYYHSNNRLALGTNGSPRLNITSTGLVGIGTAAPAIPSGGGLEIHHSSVARLKLSTTSTGVASGDGFQIYMSDSSAILENKENAEMRFYTNALERVRIDSSGRLLIGTTDTDSVSDGEVSKLIIKGTDSTASASFTRHSADAGGTGLYLGKSRNATIGSNTIVQNNDELGRITFSGDDGTNINTMGAKIASYVDGTPGENDMPGRLIFYTTADGAASVTERMRINKEGMVFIGTTDGTTVGTVDKNLIVGSTTNNDEVALTLNVMEGTNGRRVKFFLDDNDGVYGVDSTASTGVAPFLIRSSGTQQFRFDGDGLKFNTDTAAANGLDDYEEGTWTPANQYLTITNNNTATYTRVGRLVTVQFDCTYAASPSDTAQVGGRIEGLPFTAQANGFHFSPTWQASATGTVNDNESYNFLSYVNGSDNKIIFYSISNNCEAIRAQTAGKRVRGTVTYMV